jgi:hypothetical protein
LGDTGYYTRFGRHFMMLALGSRNFPGMLAFASAGFFISSGAGRKSRLVPPCSESAEITGDIAIFWAEAATPLPRKGSGVAG